MEVYSMLFLIVMCIFYIFNFIFSCWKVYFGNEKLLFIFIVVLVSIFLFYCEYKKNR